MQHCAGYLTSGSSPTVHCVHPESIIEYLIYKLRHESLLFLYAKTKLKISCTVTAQLISAFVFATSEISSLQPSYVAMSELGRNLMTDFLTTRLI